LDESGGAGSASVDTEDPSLEQEEWNIDTDAQNRIFAVQNQPRKLYGLWTMMRVLTDGDALASQATPSLIKEIVENFFKLLFEWAPCSPFRLPVLVFLLYRMQQNQSAAQSMQLFTSTLETYIPHKQFMQYSPEARSEFAQPPPLTPEHIAAAQQLVASTPSRLLDLYGSATNGLITTEGLTMGLDIPFIAQQMAVSTVVNWLEIHFNVQLTIIAAMTHYKALVLHHEAGIPRETFVSSVASASVTSDASVGSIPSQYVIQSIQHKKIEERRNAGFIPVATEASTNSTATTTAAGSSNAKAASPVPSSRYLKQSPFTYLEHIEIRLKAMVAVAHVCEVKKLGRSELDKWWVLLMRWCLTKREMKMMSVHWTNLLFNYATNHFPVTDEDMEYLFDKFATELDVAEATKTELDLVKAFVIFFAWRRDQYIPLPQRDHGAFPHGFCIRGDIVQIPGLHLFWKIATHTKDAKTAEAANTIIVSFYEYPSPDTDKAHFQTAFVMNAVSIIQSNYDALSKKTNSASSSEKVDLFTPISRCLTLVRKVLSSSVNRAAPTTRGAAIKLTLKPLNGSSVEISLYHNDPVSYIRAKAAEILKTPTHEIRLILSGKELKPEIDNLPISQARDPAIPINATIHAVKKPGMAGQSSNDSAASNQQATISVIASLLSTEPYFSLFFNVLLLASSQHKEELAQQVWSLLMDLPHNRELMTGLESITAHAESSEEGQVEGQVRMPIDWNVLLDPTNSFKLFYSLQIVESLLRPRDGPTEATERWYEAFKRSGGVSHLVRLLLTAPLTDASQGFKRFPAASLILDLLSTYLHKDHSSQTGENGAPAATTSAMSSLLGNQPVIPPSALFALLEDPSLASIESSKGSESAASATTSAPKMICLLAQRLLELGLASVIDESDLLHQDGDQSALPTSPTPSTQEEQDDANAAATIAPVVTKQSTDSASNSEILLSHLWPFILSISANSASVMLSSVISKSMKPLWQKLMQVVFLSKVHLDRVRSSLANAIMSLLTVASGSEYYEVVHPSDGSSLILTSKALIYFADLALNILTPSTLPPGLPYCHEFFSLLQMITTQLFQVPLSTSTSQPDAPKFLLQHQYSCRLLQHDPMLASFAQRLHNAVSATAQVLVSYPVIERRGDASLKDVYLIGLFEFIKSCLENFPSWIFTHPAIISGGAVPRLDDNPLKSLTAQTASNDMDVDKKANTEADAASKEATSHSIVSSIGNLLFCIPNPSNSAGALSPPSCKTAESRSAAFALLVTLTNPLLATHFETLSKPDTAVAAKTAPVKSLNPLLHLMCLATEFILPRHIGRGAIGNGIKSWAYQPLGMEKSACGYVGLRNLAATCYMNSLMQQFYMVPQFRSRVFSLAPFGLPQQSVDGTAASSEGGAGSTGVSEKKADALLDSRNVVFQLQNLFAHLQESQQKYYDPTSFTKVYKGPDGRVMNPIVQMDAEEFFTGLLDKIESVIKGTPDEKAVREFFGGTLLQQLEAKDCGHSSRREEDMLTIPVEVKGKANLYESLDAFVKADILDGDNKYQCSQCNQMVDARKFSCLGRLPDNLVFSLKRFDFDFESLMRVKVNDYFEFPTALSVEPYTAEGMKRREKADAQKARQNESSAPSEGQELTADANASQDEEGSSFDPTDYAYTLSGIVIHRGTADSGHYYSYIKDRNSSPEKPQWFLFNDMSVESFDEAYIPPLAFGGEDDSRRSLKSYSAYMLFYTKNKPSHPHTQAKLDEVTLSQAVPRDLFASTWVDNTCFLLDQQIYEKQYLEFLGTLVKAGDELNAHGALGGVSTTSGPSEGASNKTHIGDLATIALTRLNWTIITETLLQMRVKTWFADHMLTLNNLVRESPMAAKTIIAELTANTPQSVNTLMKIFVECPVNDLKQQFATLVAEALICCIKQSVVSDESPSVGEASALFAGDPSGWAALVPERGEDCPAFDAPYREHIRHFMDVWMSTILDYSKQDVSHEDSRLSVLSVINSVASVMSLALDNHSSRSVMVSLMLPYVHMIMEIMDRMPGPEDEESKKKLKDWRKSFKPLVSIIATIITSSNPAAIPPPPYVANLGLSDATATAATANKLPYDEQALAMLPIELGHLQTSTAGPEQATLPMEAWAYLLNPNFVLMLLDDPGLASSVNTASLNIFQWLADHHPAWARHLLHLCLSRMTQIGYERFENIVALLPALLSTVRRMRQLAWDTVDDVRAHLVQALLRKHAAPTDAATAAAKRADDEKWAWILFPGSAPLNAPERFLEDYLLSDSLAPEELGYALEDEAEAMQTQDAEDSAQKMLFMTPNFPVSAAHDLATLINTPDWTLSKGSAGASSTWTPIKRVASLAKIEMLHSAFVHWAAHKAFPALLEAKKALKFASYWALRCLLDCVETDFAMRSLFQSSATLFEDFLPHFIIFEKDEKVRALAERFFQSMVVSNDVRRRIWRSNSDDSLFDSTISSSTINSIFLPVPIAIVPRRHLPAEIDPLWEERDQFKNGIEIVLGTTGVLTLPDSDELKTLDAAIHADNVLINKAMQEEQMVDNRHLCTSSHPLVVLASQHTVQLVELIDYESELSGLAGMVQTSVAILRRLWGVLLRIVKALTKADAVSPIDAAREKERLSSHELLFKYRLVQLLRLMTWVLLSMPHEHKRALQQACFDECWPTLWMLWKEGVGENFDFNRTALYAFVDVLSHRFTPILAALGSDPSFMHMNIHVNYEKSVAGAIGKFNDRTSSHFFRIILRTILYLDSEKRKQSGLPVLTSIFGPDADSKKSTEASNGGLQKPRFTLLSTPESLIDIAIVRNESKVSDETEEALENPLVTKLNSMPAWDWAMDWLFMRGYERCPTMVIYLEQLIRLVLHRLPRREHMATITISLVESLRLDLNSIGAARLLLLSTTGMLLPEVFLHQIDEKSSGSPLLTPSGDGLARMESTPQAVGFALYNGVAASEEAAEKASKVGEYLANPLDASNAFVNPYKTLASSPYAHVCNAEASSANNAHGLTVTDWNLSYAPMSPTSPLITLELPAEPVLAQERLTAWIQELWLLIEQRLVGVTIGMLLSTHSQQYPLGAILTSLITHPTQSPTTLVHRSAIDVLQTLRLALSWILPLQLASRAPLASDASPDVAENFFHANTGILSGFHRPLLPLQRIMFEIFNSDETLSKTALELVKWLHTHQSAQMEQLVTILTNSVIMRDPNAASLVGSNLSEAHGLRVSLTALALDIVDALSLVSLLGAQEPAAVPAAAGAGSKPALSNLVLTSLATASHSHLSFVPTPGEGTEDSTEASESSKDEGAPSLPSSSADAAAGKKQVGDGKSGLSGGTVTVPPRPIATSYLGFAQCAAALSAAQAVFSAPSDTTPVALQARATQASMAVLLAALDTLVKGLPSHPFSANPLAIASASLLYHAPRHLSTSLAERCQLHVQLQAIQTNHASLHAQLTTILAKWL
jgi:ubiquitin C-terminal hydrolase